MKILEEAFAPVEKKTGDLIIKQGAPATTLDWDNRAGRH
jgi:hypothetical protein